jgi:hypothetical protein
MLPLGNPFFDTNRNKIIAFAAQQKRQPCTIFGNTWLTAGS